MDEAEVRKIVGELIGEIITPFTEELDKKLRKVEDDVNEAVALVKALKIGNEEILKGFRASHNEILKEADIIKRDINNMRMEFDDLVKKERLNSHDIKQIADIITTGKSNMGDLKLEGLG